MTLSATQHFLSEILSSGQIPPSKLGYFQARLTGLVHQAMLSIFGKLAREKEGFTKRDFARRIGRKPEQITRWLAYPSNLTLETVSDVFAGAGYELESIVLRNLATRERHSYPERTVSAVAAALQNVMQAPAPDQSQSMSTIDAYLGLTPRGRAERSQTDAWEQARQMNEGLAKNSMSLLRAA